VTFQTSRTSCPAGQAATPRKRRRHLYPALLVLTLTGSTVLGAAVGTSSAVGAELAVSARPAATHASAGSVRLDAATGGIVGSAPLPKGGGFWTAFSNGTVVSNGSAPFLGDMSGQALNAPIIGIAATADGGGYWLLAADGGIFTFGDAKFYGSTGAQALAAPIVAMAASPTGGGYWLVGSNGAVFAFGDAKTFGDLAQDHLNAPILGIAPVASGDGYWLVASDGGIFTFGAARFFGSTGAMSLNAPVVAMASTASGNGYWLVASDGGIFTFGDARYQGSAAGTLGSGHAVAIVPTANGYWIPTSNGTVGAYNAPVLDVTPLAAPAPAAASVPASAMAIPAADIAPAAAFGNACYSATDSPTCDQVALQAIDTARAAEGLGPMQLPAGYASMSADQQLVTVTNLERTDRGLPAFSGPVSALDVTAAAGLAANSDPVGPAGRTWASNWMDGLASPLAADYLWMYDDGPGSNNIACTATNSSGCWKHRTNILSPWAGSIGVDVAPSGASGALTQLFVGS
jgi:hypothetical protein